MIRRQLITAILLLMMGAGPAMGTPSLTIAAAASLRHAMDEILVAWEADHPSERIAVIYGSSGKMSAQIRNGAPYDMFFAADMDVPQSLYDAGLGAAPPRVYALGRLVLAWRKDDQPLAGLHDLTRANIHRIAIAQPRHAPYGQRAREALDAVGIWDQLVPRLVFGENIAQAAQMVAAGGADAGMIALSLMRAPEPSRFRYTLIDDSLHEPLTQGFMITRRAIDNTTARDFAQFIGAQTAQDILQDYGFAIPTSSESHSDAGH